MGRSFDLAAAVHLRCRERGLSLSELAALTNYSTSYLSKMLHGHRRLLPGAVAEIDRVLDAGGELEKIARAQGAQSAAFVRAMQLPPAAPGFLGRESYLYRMDAALITHERPGSPGTIVIEGGFWVGKTALAVHWAARIHDRFPGGCLFADLRGLATTEAPDPAEVLDGFLRALGAQVDTRSSVVDRAGHYRSLLAQRPAVVVLDNIASYDQVEHLIPAAGSVVVVTSRQHQSALLLHTGGLHLQLCPLAQREALALLRKRLGDARVDVDLVAAETVVRKCGRLPMAVIAAAEYGKRRHHGSLHNLATELDTEALQDVLASVDPAVNINDVIAPSYLALPPTAKRVFRLLGISPAHVAGVGSTAALAGLDTREAREALDLLRQANLLEDASSGRMCMNHLVRAHAYQRAMIEESALDREQAHDRVVRWYAATASMAGNALAPDWCGNTLTLDDTGDLIPLTFDNNAYDTALTWYDTEVDIILELARHAHRDEVRDASWMLPTLLLPYFYVTKKWSAWLSAAAEGLAAARAIASPEGIAWSLHSLGWARQGLGHTEKAVIHLREALRLRTELDDDRARAWAAFSLGIAYLPLNRPSDARDCLELADGIFTDLSFDLGLAFTRAGLAHLHQAAGEADAASRLAHDSLSKAQKVRSVAVVSHAHHHLGLLLHQQDQHRAALAHLDAALALRRQSHERWGQAETLITRAETFEALREPSRARESYLQAADLLESLHDPRAFEIRADLAPLNVCQPSRAR